MSETLTRAFIVEKNKTQQASPFVFLYTVPLPDEVLRVCSYTEELTVTRTDSEGADVDLTFEPAPLKMQGMNLQGDGRAGQLRVTIQDVGRVLEALLEEHDGLTDIRVEIELINVSTLDEVGVRFYAYVVAQTSEEAGSEFSLGAHPGLRGSTLRWFNKRRCTHRYGGRLCGVSLLVPGAPPTCSLFLRGPNGCLAKRIWQQTSGQRVNLPGAFGAQIAMTGARR